MELEQEIKYFESHREEWLKTYEGKFTLIKGEKLINTFTTAEEAYTEGIKQFGNVPFFIKQILKEDIPDSLPALTLGLINAHI